MLLQYGPHFFSTLSEKFGQLARFFWANGLPPPLAKNFPYAYGLRRQNFSRTRTSWAWWQTKEYKKLNQGCSMKISWKQIHRLNFIIQQVASCWKNRESIEFVSIFVQTLAAAVIHVEYNLFNVKQHVMTSLLNWMPWQGLTSFKFCCSTNGKRCCSCWMGRKKFSNFKDWL